LTRAQAAGYLGALGRIATMANPSKSRILPPIYFGGAILSMAALHFLFPGPQWPDLIWQVAGACLLLVGIVVILVSARLFERHHTAIKPFERSESLVVKGPYRFSRNPMYLGMLSILTGIGLLLGSTTPLLIVPIFMWLISVRFVALEERMLVDRFGALYEDYCKRVRRWL
jgi:protein-S-isoprenylcysteine O-methyltransferase Ste14